MDRFTSKDFLAGAMFIGLGLAALSFGWHLNVGTGVRMGPGYVPRMLSGILIFLGLVIAVKALVAGSDRIDTGLWKPILMITLGVIAFGTLLEADNIPSMVGWFVKGLPRWENPVSGLIPALVALVFLAALGGNEFKLKETIGSCVVLTIICLVIFKFGLKMNIRILGGVQ